MDISSAHLRQWFFLAIITCFLFGYVFFSPGLDNIVMISHVNQWLGACSIFYLKYIGTNAVYAYFFIALLILTICQWHLRHFVAYKALFIALSLALTIIIIQCSGVFFSGYTEHLSVSPQTDVVHLVHNSFTSVPAGHVARLVALITAICMLMSLWWMRLVLIVVASLILAGMGVAFYDRFFIVGSTAGALVGYFVPYYLRLLLFTQRSTTRLWVR